MRGLPLRDGDDAPRVSWFEIEVALPNGKVACRNSFVTDLDITAENIAELAACCRARWKIENETFNVLKQRGYHLEHNFGHGKKTLAGVLAALHTACDLAENQWRQARKRLGSRTRMFEHMRTIVCYRLFPSWAALSYLCSPPAAHHHNRPEPPQPT